MKLSFSNMTLELNMVNICKWRRDKLDENSENEEIELFELIIEKHVQDEISTNSVEICFACSFQSSKKLECNTANICFILDSMQVPKDDSSQLNYEGMRQLDETKEEEAPKLE